MRNKTTKIVLFILSFLVLYSCSLVKRVPDGKYLLEKNEITVNGKEKNDDDLKAQMYQLPNTDILGYHLRLHMYNLAKPNADSSYLDWLDRKPGRHEFLTGLLSEKQVRRLGNSFLVSGLSNFYKKTGEPPVLVDVNRIKKSSARLYAYHYKKGYFRVKTDYSIDTLPDKRAVVNYKIDTDKPYIVDSITPYIETPVLDSLYKTTTKEAVIKRGKQYDEADFTAERERITASFRDHGAYYFQQNNISYVLDTVNTGYKANVDLNIENETVRRGDSTFTRPFKLYKISRVNIFTKNPSSDSQAIDSTTYKDFHVYSTGELNYRPKAITDAIFIAPGSTYADFRRVLTSRYLSNLKVFNYPTIQYVEDTTDVTRSSLITNIYLNPRKKFHFFVTADFNHSNIQDFGIQGSMGLSIRNIFRGAEILELSTRGNIGSSRDLNIQDRTFFNILEYGADVKLNIPRIWFPFRTESIIPKRMIPSTIVSFGIASQKNIGLDKENFTGILSYNWTPRRNKTAKLDLFNIQYIRNVNAGAYFNVYKSSYRALNNIARSYPDLPLGYFDESGNLPVNSVFPFVDDVLNNRTGVDISETDYNNVRRLEERRVRLTENNLIFASNFTYTTSTRENINDNGFFIFKTKVESAGNVLSLLSGLLNENDGVPTGEKTIFDVKYAQYIKGELDFIKHFDLRRGKVLAMRAFFGLAVPYGNASSIPFTRSYFGGGSNDNRGWQSYRLGPGRSGGLNDFNEANLKMSYSAELRFNMFGKLNGALFADVGNIWNVFDDEDDKDLTFNGLKSFEDLALGTGVGFRYDFNFFVIRLDVGFKTYNPGLPEGTRWFREYNFANSVLNVGINYPF
ncbi:BamA/TamA family outer membrane protein [Flavobacterium sp. Sd200]|uniref:translocation and assembly module lipoprotein TamL n=1 Tax=Flavobacterium sp. Sd200 TaxID=2692211 RepID=UPI00136C81E7|nr:BamA/TamA family outer membrane protein [Flavobacterium sp. Sd200]MXN91879.1 BamA/TamA family outer membrane protein [Flavobacterium sp. Sd200]